MLQCIGCGSALFSKICSLEHHCLRLVMGVHEQRSSTSEENTENQSISESINQSSSFCLSFMYSLLKVSEPLMYTLEISKKHM